MAPPPITEEPEEEEWLVTFADAITLLMAFFVMLVSFSKIDLPTFEQVMAGIKKEIGTADARSPTQMLKTNIEDVIFSMQAERVVNITLDDKGVVVELNSAGFFHSGSAELRPESHDVMEKMGLTIKAPRFRHYFIEVEGHTDDVPIHTAKFPSNWELSSARASGIVRFLGARELDPRRMKAVGMADTQPKLPNSDAHGNPIVENQAANRRVLMRIYPMSIEQRQNLLESVSVDMTRDPTAPQTEAEPDVPPIEEEMQATPSDGADGEGDFGESDGDMTSTSPQPDTQAAQ